MTSARHFASAIVAVATIGVLHAQQAGQTTRGSTAPTVALIGCVERVVPAKPAAATSASPGPTYKLIDVQPGSGVAQKPKVYAKEYFIVGAESIALSKYQNQWVEVTGTMTAAPTGAPATGGDKPATPPLGTVTVTAVKVVATECK